MSEDKKKQLTITITGEVKAGKTALSGLLCGMLEEFGFEIESFEDEGAPVSNRSALDTHVENLMEAGFASRTKIKINTVLAQRNPSKS